MNPITTANKLKTFRNLKGLTPEQVARKAQLNLDEYKTLESGKTAVSVEKLEKVCKALELDMQEWFETDKSNVIINTDFKDNAKGGNNVDCDNCYFYERSEEDTQILETLSAIAETLVKKLDDEILARKIEQVLRKNMDLTDDKEE